MRLEANWRVLLPLMLSLLVFEALFELPPGSARDASGFLFAAGWAFLCAFILGLYHLLRPVWSVRSAPHSTLKARAEKEEEGVFTKAVAYAKEAGLEPGRILVRVVETRHTRSFGLPDLGSEIQLPAESAQSNEQEPAAVQRQLGALAHELGHLKHRDALRSFAIDVVFTWAYLWCLAPLLLIFAHRDLLAAPWNALFQYLLAAKTPPETDGFFFFGVLALGFGVGWRLLSWQKSLHHQMETEADELARGWAGKEAAKAALPKREAAYVAPFSSHPPAEERRKRLENQFSSAGARKDAIGALAFQHAAFLLAGVLVLLLLLQVRFVNERLRDRAGEAVAQVRVVQDEATNLAGTLDGLDLSMADAGTRLRLSSSQLLDDLGNTRSRLGTQREGLLGKQGALPHLVDGVERFSTGLSQMQSEAWLGLPATDGSLPDGGLMQKVARASEVAERSLAQAPAVLGMLPDGGMASSGPLPAVAQEAGQLARALAAVSGVVAGHAGTSGKEPECATQPPDRKALESMNLEARLECLNQLAGARILVAAKQLELERKTLEDARVRLLESPPGHSDAGSNSGSPDAGVLDTPPGPHVPEPPDGGPREAAAMSRAGNAQ